jgi:hypothetical protein
VAALVGQALTEKRAACGHPHCNFLSQTSREEVMQIRLVLPLVLGASLIPAIAHGQPPLNPDDPTDPNAPVPTPIDPTPAPTVIVNPPPPAPVYTTEPEYETHTSAWNAPMFTTGALVFLGSYGASVIVAASTEDDEVDRGNDRLYVPVVGPWLALNDRPDCPIEQESCDMETTKKVLLVLDGVLQAGGVVTMVAGLLSPTEYRVVKRPAVVSGKVHVSPTAGANPGISLFGHF